MAIEKVELFDDSSVVVDMVSESVGDSTNQEFIRRLFCLMQLPPHTMELPVRRSLSGILHARGVLHVLATKCY